MPSDFPQFFRTATGHAPYAYQCRLTCGEGANLGDDSTLVCGTDCRSQLIEIPTGLGKTAAVVLAWLWNRAIRQSLNSQQSTINSQWPRRLVYCLPMRTLVEQTRDEASKWVNNLANAFPDSGELKTLAKYSPIILMGGEDAGDWDIYPERPAILIGTQDMLLSRALNRGYGMSRYRWPMHFGLLNNDALWVMDETQLMGVGVETSAQLDGFRRNGKMPTFGASPTWWMSATFDESRVATVDHPKPAGGWQKLELSEAERSSGRAQELFEAAKAISQCPFVLSPATKANYARELATWIQRRHQFGTLTLVVLNRVSRAQEVYDALTGGKEPLCDRPRWR